MTLEDCRGRCSMDYSIPIDEVTNIFKLNQWKWQHLTKNTPMSRSSKWNSALRGKMLEGATENNKDGERKRLNCLLSLQNQNTTDISNSLGITATKTAFAKTSCTKGKEETGIASSPDRLANPLALRLKMFANFPRY